jgi:hypothetical protein
MSRFGGGTEKCWVCTKGVYSADPKINLDGNIHKGCAKCSDCGLKLVASDAIVIKDGDKKFIVCPTHNKGRLNNKGNAPKNAPVETGDIMSSEMKAALTAAPAPAAPPAPASAAATASAARPPPPVPKAGGGGGLSSNQMSTLEKVNAVKANTADRSVGDLVADLQTKDGVDQLRAIAFLADKTSSQEERLELAKENLGLLATLAKVIQGENVDCRIGAIGIVWKLSIEESNRLAIIKAETGLLVALNFILSDDERLEAKAKSLGALHNITLAAEAQKACSKVPNMVNNLVTLLKHENIDVMDRAVGVLWNLATLPDNRESLAGSASLLAGVGNMLTVTDTGDTDIPGKALVVLYYLTLPVECRAAVASADGVLENMCKFLKSSTIQEDGQIKMMSMLINLSSAAENKARLCSAELGFVPELLKILKTTKLPDLKNKICGCLWNLSVATENRAYMASTELGMINQLVSILMVTVRSEETDEAVIKSQYETATKSCVILQNLAGEAANHPAMIDPDVKMLPTLAKVILKMTGDIRLKAFGAIVNLSLSQNTQAAIGSAEGSLMALMSILKDDSVGDFRVRAAGVLQNLAVDADNRVAMGADPDLQVVPVAVSFLAANSKSPLLAPSLGMLLNMSVSNENKKLIGGQEELIGYLTKIVENEQAAIKVKALSLIWSLSSDKPTRDIMKGSHELIDAISKAASEDGDVAKKALGALGNLAPGMTVK